MRYTARDFQRRQEIAMSTVQERVWETLDRLTVRIEEFNRGAEEVRRSVENLSRAAEERSKETDLKFQETDRKFQETDLKFKETDRKFKESFQETERLFQENERRFRETDKKFREMSELFTGQWGKLVEALVRPGLLELFRKRGFPVYEAMQRDEVKRGGRQMEIDVMLADDDIVIPVEVKTTLKVQDIDDFLKRMEEFPFFFPKYRSYRVYGAVAGVKIEENADRYAYRKGLFVLTLGGNGLCAILNDEKFKPRNLLASAANLPS
jgi:hypothetical protein